MSKWQQEEQLSLSPGNWSHVPRPALLTDQLILLLGTVCSRKGLLWEQRLVRQWALFRLQPRGVCSAGSFFMAPRLPWAVRGFPVKQRVDSDTIIVCGHSTELDQTRYGFSK